MSDPDQKKMDKVLKRMLKTPPKPFTPKKEKNGDRREGETDRG
ncbi:hypothetical protein [uncultured Parasphingopyxis sp.]|nr:hypothetical protein [uncultured Parasphingopyxis sp.]